MQGLKATYTLEEVRGYMLGVMEVCEGDIPRHLADKIAAMMARVQGQPTLTVYPQPIVVRPWTYPYPSWGTVTITNGIHGVTSAGGTAGNYALTSNTTRWPENVTPTDAAYNLGRSDAASTG